MKKQKEELGWAATTHPVHSVSAFKSDAGVETLGSGAAAEKLHQQEGRVSRLKKEVGDVRTAQVTVHFLI